MSTEQPGPAFSAGFRSALIDHVSAGPRAEARRHRRIIAGVATALAIAAAGGTAYALSVDLPGGTTTTPLAAPVIVVRTGTATIDLGPRPAGTTSVSTELTCLSPGRFEYPDGATNICSPADFTGTTPNRSLYLLAMAPGRRAITITATPGASWRLKATYVTAVTTAWGVNAKGETYGVVNEHGEPDLIAALATNGRQGYVYVRDMNAADPAPASPEEAAAIARENARKSFTVLVYESDGETSIGEFVFGG